MLKSLRIQNLLSYGPNMDPLELKNLNVLIGANGSGKSNLLEVIALLKAAPENLAGPVKESGGVGEWIYKPAHSSNGRGAPEALIEVVVRAPNRPQDLRHAIVFTEHGQRFEVVDETISYEDKLKGKAEPFFFYKFQRGHPILNELTQDSTGKRGRRLTREEVHPEQSILSQVKDPGRYPELHHLSRQYPRILMLRDWTFGRYTGPRREQKLGLPNDGLTDTCDNLALVLADILPQVEDELISHLQALYPRITRLYARPSGDRLQLTIKEGNLHIPATRLSDGTLRYLSLLTALLHPEPAPLICIDEPELGLHPDVIPALAELLVSSSQRTQLIVATHSDILVDALGDVPESIVTVEATGDGSRLRRLDASHLDKWMSKYSLGELWTRGEIGGVRS